MKFDAELMNKSYLARLPDEGSLRFFMPGYFYDMPLPLGKSMVQFVEEGVFINRVQRHADTGEPIGSFASGFIPADQVIYSTWIEPAPPLPGPDAKDQLKEDGEKKVVKFKKKKKKK